MQCMNCMASVFANTLSRLVCDARVRLHDQSCVKREHHAPSNLQTKANSSSSTSLHAWIIASSAPSRGVTHARAIKSIVVMLHRPVHGLASSLWVVSKTHQCNRNIRRCNNHIQLFTSTRSLIYPALIPRCATINKQREARQIILESVYALTP